MPSPSMDWLPQPEPDWSDRLRKLVSPALDTWVDLVGMANTRLDAMGTLQVDRSLRRLFPAGPPPGLSTVSVRLALLGTATLDHLLPFLRVGALRHGLWLAVCVGDYGDCRVDAREREVDTVLFAHDARTLLSGLDAEAGAADALQDVCDRLVGEWRAASAQGCSVLQQTLLPVFPPAFGNNEHRLPSSPASAVETLNLRLGQLADSEGVDLVAVHRHAAQDGIGAWHDPALWYRAKQEIHPGAASLYGDLVGRLLAARQGRSRKALVLDLDNTLWGGVVGDDGMEGLVLGQGSALGEAFVDVQHYARALSRRGIVLAVCSKNDEAFALEPFEKHPDMVLRSGDIACFVANWSDKAGNLRHIAEQLALGIDSLVFLDDNPAERALIRRELPDVAVPELPDDPAGFPAALAAAGYFEGVRLSSEDRSRTEQYQANRLRRADAQVTDMEGYLQSLAMVLHWGSVDAISAPRVVQLINKSNQFNLTTRRTTDAALAATLVDPAVIAIQMRLVDRFGNNGLIAVVMAVHRGADVTITDWLMSCRVLKRGVEAGTYNVIVANARLRGASRLLGSFCPTAKNGMVRDHYAALGFAPLGEEADGTTRWSLDLATAPSLPTALSYEPAVPTFEVAFP